MEIYKLKNDNGLIVEFMSLGARINAIKVPYKGGYKDVVVGYDTADEAAKGDEYFGAICGRVANRIAEGKFTLEGKEYQLEQNSDTNALHGGSAGFHKKLWKVEKTVKKGCVDAYKLSIVSEDGDSNYPGELKVELIYSLNNDNEFAIDIKASCDKTTIVNLTAHPYFNLNGVGGGNVLEHLLEINAKEFTPLSEKSVPTGEIRAVEGTAMDLRKPSKIKDIVGSSYQQITQVGGIDHNWVINKQAGECEFALRLSDAKSEISLELHTSQPGVQVYAAMHFDGTEKAKGKIPLNAFDGLAIEAQNFPDAINHSNFPNSILKPNEEYNETIIYKFVF